MTQAISQHLEELAKVRGAFCTEVEASEITGYSTAWLRKHRTPTPPADPEKKTPVVAKWGGGTLYAKASLVGIRNRAKEGEA